MGLFDRFKNQNVRRYEYAGPPIADRQWVSGNVKTAQPSDRWLWLLLIPLFFLLMLSAYTYLASPTGGIPGLSGPNFLGNLFNNGNTSQKPENGNNSGLQFGVGGAPATPTPVQSRQSPTTPEAPSSTSSDDPQGSVQAASDQKIPSEAPSTGRSQK